MGHEPLVEFFRQVGTNAGLRVAVKPRDGLTVNPNSNRKPDLSFNDHLPNSDGCSPLPRMRVCGGRDLGFRVHTFNL